MEQVESSSWWGRPCGGREVLRMALPLIVSTSLWTVMHFTDRMFLLWHSNAAMAAAMPAGLLHFTLLCFPLGIVSYVNTFVAQYYGAERWDQIGRVLWQGVWLAILFAPLFLATIPLAAIVFPWIGHEPLVARQEMAYYQVLTWGAGGVLVSTALSTFFTGRGSTSVVMYVDGASALLNVVLDYLWIFGHAGFPAAGIVGAAWATVVAQWAAAALYAVILCRPAYRQRYALAAGLRWDAALLGRLYRYGGPNGLQMLVELSSFTVFILLVGRLGTEAMAATTLAFNVNSVAFVPMLGLGIAVSTIVGQQLGRDAPALAARATWVSFQIAVLYMGTMAVLYVLIPDVFLLGHASGTTPERFAQLRDVTVILLRFVAAYCLFDAMNVIFVSAIKGAGDTRFILVTTLLMAPLPMVIGWLGIDYGGWNLIHCWVLITVWVCVLGLTYLGRFLQGRWRQMRVIEPHS